MPFRGTTLWLIPGLKLFPGGGGGGGGTDLERGYGDVRPWRPPFHASPAARKGPISKSQFTRPLLRKFGNFSLNSLNFHPNFSSQAPNSEIFSSQAPKFGNFQLTSPQIWKFSAHKPPFSEANVSSQAPHFGNPGRTPLPEKKLSAPLPPGLFPSVHTDQYDYSYLLFLLMYSMIQKTLMLIDSNSGLDMFCEPLVFWCLWFIYFIFQRMWKK